MERYNVIMRSSHREKRTFHWLLCAILLILPRPAFSQKKSDADFNSGIVYGKKFSFGITAPKGWVMDTEAGKSQQANVVFYHQGESWAEGNAVMYASVVNPTKRKSLKQLTANDIANFKSENPRVKISVSVPLKTRDNRLALTYVFQNASAGALLERVTYLDMGGFFLTVVLTAKTKTAFEKALADHSSLVRSIFATPKVIN